MRASVSSEQIASARISCSDKSLKFFATAFPRYHLIRDLVIAKLRMHDAKIRPGMNVVCHQLDRIVNVVVETAGNGTDAVVGNLIWAQLFPFQDSSPRESIIDESTLKTGCSLH